MTGKDRLYESVLTQMRKLGRTDSLAMGLLAKATVATGAKPKNNLILLASSGRVENAMNAGKEQKQKH